MTRYGTALILGLGASGVAAAGLLLREGTKVTAVDSGDDDKLRLVKARLESEGAEVILGCKDLPAYGFDICVISPGVPCDSDWVRRLRSANVKIVSELELGASRCACRVIGITGSKGKSTLAKICGEGLARAGFRVEVCGNYGLPFSDVACRSQALDWAVVEVSSFQLEFVETFSPDIGVLLNVQPDHLDRHGSMERYRSLKYRLFAGMRAGGLGVVACEEIDLVRGESGGGNRWVSFGVCDGVEYYYSDSCVGWGDGILHGRLSVKGTIFDNEVMGLTAAAAVAVLLNCGLEADAIEGILREYMPLPHRMEKVAEKRGVQFINDSKATNLAAMAAGLKMAGGGVMLIAGGQLKEKDLSFVKEVLVKHVKTVYLIGESSEAMLSAWGSFVTCRHCGDLYTAVREAIAEAVSGDVVLLSPGCASFDQFRDYKDRGNQFKKIVNEEAGLL